MFVKPNATIEQIDYACEIADIANYIHSLPKAYDTVIGEQGIKLSGGQRQRLAIARLVLYNPQIAILDEATSSLDSISESRVLSNLNNFFEGKTLIIISHKPVLPIRFDEVISIEKGALIAEEKNGEDML